MKHNLFHK